MNSGSACTRYVRCCWVEEQVTQPSSMVSTLCPVDMSI